MNKVTIVLLGFLLLQTNCQFFSAEASKDEEFSQLSSKTLITTDNGIVNIEEDKNDNVVESEANQVFLSTDLAKFNFDDYVAAQLQFNGQDATEPQSAQFEIVTSLQDAPIEGQNLITTPLDDVDSAKIEMIPTDTQSQSIPLTVNNNAVPTVQDNSKHHHKHKSDSEPESAKFEIVDTLPVGQEQGQNLVANNLNFGVDSGKFEIVGDNTKESTEVVQDDTNHHKRNHHHEPESAKFEIVETLPVAQEAGQNFVANNVDFGVDSAKFEIVQDNNNNQAAQTVEEGSNNHHKHHGKNEPESAKFEIIDTLPVAQQNGQTLVANDQLFVIDSAKFEIVPLTDNTNAQNELASQDNTSSQHHHKRHSPEEPESAKFEIIDTLPVSQENGQNLVANDGFFTIDSAKFEIVGGKQEDTVQNAIVEQNTTKHNHKSHTKINEPESAKFEMDDSLPAAKETGQNLVANNVNFEVDSAKFEIVQADTPEQNVSEVPLKKHNKSKSQNDKSLGSTTQHKQTNWNSFLKRTAQLFTVSVISKENKQKHVTVLKNQSKYEKLIQHQRNFNHPIHSIYIPKGLSLTIYDEPNFKGEQHKFIESQKCLVKPIAMTQITFNKAKKSLSNNNLRVKKNK